MPAPRRAFTGCSDRIGPICVHAWQRQHNGGAYENTPVRYVEHEDGGPALMRSGYVGKKPYTWISIFMAASRPFCPVGRRFRGTDGRVVPDDRPLSLGRFMSFLSQRIF